MIDSTEIANGIHRLSLCEDPVLAGRSFPDSSYNMFLIDDERPAIINNVIQTQFPA